MIELGHHPLVVRQRLRVVASRGRQLLLGCLDGLPQAGARRALDLQIFPHRGEREVAVGQFRLEQGCQVALAGELRRQLFVRRLPLGCFAPERGPELGDALRGASGRQAQLRGGRALGFKL